MENNETYYTELSLAMAERNAKRYWILCIIIFVVLFLALVISNICWIRYENSFEDVVITQDNADGYNSYIGNDGDINYGETNDQN
jgi:hypothetical protein